METWSRGKPKLTPEQRAIADAHQRDRVKIANLVKRKKEISKECCLCGKEGRIMHNKNGEPYKITFICTECSNDPAKLEEAENHRFDIREKLEKTNLRIHNIPLAEQEELVETYFNSIVSIGDYCKEKGISRHQFSLLLNKYKESHPDVAVDEKVKGVSKRVQQQRLTKIIFDKAMYASIE